jgi:hypothetical protein
VFPGFFHPTEHHLGLVTRLPAIHYLFGAATLVEAYRQVLDQRGPEHAWYSRRSSRLADWEKGNTINGATARSFRRWIEEERWDVDRRCRLPLFRVGRSIDRRPWLGLLGRALTPLARIPLIEEAFCHRITYVLSKP